MTDEPAAELTPVERRRALMREVAEADLQRALAFREMLQRPGVQTFAADVAALYDPTEPDNPATPGINAVLRVVATQLQTVPHQNERLIEGLQNFLNPQAPAPLGGPPAVPVPAQ